MSDVSNEKLDELEKLAQAVLATDRDDESFHGAWLRQNALDAFADGADPPTVLALIAELRRCRGDA